MERKWIGPQDFWSIYKEENGAFSLKDSTFEKVWQETFFDSWKSIEDFMKRSGYVEDCAHYAAGNIVVVPGSILQKRPGLTSGAALLALMDLDALKTNRSLYSYLSAIKINDGCPHEWTTYTGFMKQETYCTKCNEVRK